MSSQYRDQVPLNLSNDVGQVLGRLLSSHYSRSADIKAMLRETGVSPATINWDQPVTLVWRQVLTTLAEQGKLPTLLQELIHGPDAVLAYRLRELMADQAAKIPMIAAHVDDPVVWATLKYVAGPSLAETVQKNGPLPPEAVKTLGVHLAEALSVIHAAGIIHGDVKPSNILLDKDGFRLVDFDAAQRINVLKGAWKRNPEYMSPELATGQAASSSSDVFSLGAVLVYAATGEGPFGHGSPAYVLWRLLEEPPRLDRVPEVLRPVIEPTLAKDPHSRPTVAHLREMLASPSPSHARHSPPSSETAHEEPGEDAPRTGTQEKSELPAPPSPVRWLQKRVLRVFGWMIPPAALAVLQSDQEALKEGGLRFIEAEIDRVYSALGPPPELEGPVSGGRFDVERD